MSLRVNATANVTATDVHNCTAWYGGGIRLDLASLALSNSTFRACAASSTGGALHLLEGSAADVSSTDFTGCTSRGWGGAITRATPPIITPSPLPPPRRGEREPTLRCHISLRSPRTRTAVDRANLTMRGSSVSDCVGSTAGGLLVWNSAAELEACTFRNNTARELGGAVFVEGAPRESDAWSARGSVPSPAADAAPLPPSRPGFPEYTPDADCTGAWCNEGALVASRRVAQS